VKRHESCFMEKAGFERIEPRSLGTKAATALHARYMNSTTVQRGTPVSAVIPRLIYTFGEVVGEDREDIKVSIEQLNSHPGIQRKYEQLEYAGFKYLQFSSLHGTGIAAKIDIPQNTELSYYIGAVCLRCSMQSSWQSHLRRGKQRSNQLVRQCHPCSERSPVGVQYAYGES
jgi:hypothetical protein